MCFEGLYDRVLVVQNGVKDYRGGYTVDVRRRKMV